MCECDHVDLHFLEECERAAQARVSADLRRVPQFLKYLQRKAHIRKIRLSIMPPMMKKRRDNKTRWDSQRKEIIWSVAVSFFNVSVPYFFTEASENTTVREVVSSVLRNKLSRDLLVTFQECDESELCVLLKRDRIRPTQKAYLRISMDGELAAAMENQEIVEYPTLLVAKLSDLQSIDADEYHSFAPTSTNTQAPDAEDHGHSEDEFVFADGVGEGFGLVVERALGAKVVDGSAPDLSDVPLAEIISALNADFGDGPSSIIPVIANREVGERSVGQQIGGDNKEYEPVTANPMQCSQNGLVSLVEYECSSDDEEAPVQAPILSSRKLQHAP
eukprot:ANDGO_03206.mRNA.2 hypothetical protein GUITHDRAFT_119053